MQGFEKELLNGAHGFGGPGSRNGPPVGQQFAAVIEEHDPVAEQAPSLFGVVGDETRRVVVGSAGGRAGWLVLAHGSDFRLTPDA